MRKKDRKSDGSHVAVNHDSEKSECRRMSEIILSWNTMTEMFIKANVYFFFSLFCILIKQSRDLIPRYLFCVG